MPVEFWLALGPILSAAVAFIGIYLTSRQASRKMSLIDSRKIDLDEANRRAEDTQRVIDNLRAELERVKNRNHELSVQLERERQVSAELRGLVRELTKTANDLRFKVELLQKRLGEEEV